MPGFNSTLIASLQGTLTGGQEIDIPAMLLPTIEVGLPLAATPNGSQIDLRNGQNSIWATAAINQGNSSALQVANLAILDRGIYRLSGWLYAVFTGGFADSSADPAGAVLLLVNPPQTQSQLFAFTGTKASANVVPIQILPSVIQFPQSGWVIQASTNHATGAAQTIGLEVALFIEKLI